MTLVCCNKAELFPYNFSHLSVRVRKVAAIFLCQLTFVDELLSKDKIKDIYYHVPIYTC